MSGQHSRIGRRFGTSIVTTLFVAGVFAAVAWAATNSVTVHVPSNAKASASTCGTNGTGCKPYPVSLSGHAAKLERLYVFLDYQACGANPAVEHANHAAPGYVWGVKGDFSKSKKWYSEKTGTDHACAYLQKATEPENAAGGIVAKDFASFTIHK